MKYSALRLVSYPHEALDTTEGIYLVSDLPGSHRYKTDDIRRHGVLGFELNGYEHLKSLGLGYHFYQGKYLTAIADVLDTDRKTILHIPSVNAGGR